jgi:hypothetical protein
MGRPSKLGKLAAIARLAGTMLWLTGCVEPAAPDTPSPDTPSYDPGPTGDPGTVGAGSFPRSFLIPGTDTSIRIGG